MSVLDTSKDLYQSLDSKGQGYMREIFGYASDDVKKLQTLLKNRDDLSKANSINSRYGGKNRAKHQKEIDMASRILRGQKSIPASYQHMKLAIQKSAKSLPRKDRKERDKVNQLAESKEFASGMNNDNLFYHFGQAVKNINKNPQKRGNKNSSFTKKLNNVSQSAQSKSKATRSGVKLYRGLSRTGQNYFIANFRQAKYGLGRLHRIKNADVADLKEPSEKKGKKRLLNMAEGLAYDKKRKKYLPNYKKVPEDEKKNVDNYFDKESTGKAVKNNDLKDGLEKFNNRVHSKVENNQQRYKDVSSANPKKEDFENLDKGMSLYSSLSSKGQQLFMMNLSQADNAEAHNKSFYDIKRSAYGKLSSYQKKERDRRSDFANGFVRGRDGLKRQRNESVPQREQFSISHYFNKNLDSIVKDGSLSENIHQINVYQDLDKIDKNNPHIHIGNEEKTNPEHYVKMLENGAQINQIMRKSPNSDRNLKYLMTSTEEATNNLDDYFKAINRNPKDLTPNQMKIKSRLQKVAGWETTDNGQEVPTSDKSMSSENKTLVDKYLNNRTTQEGLKKGDVQTTLIAQNKRKREIAETKKDEEAKKNNGLNPVGIHLKRRHPYAFALGYSLGNVDSPFQIHQIASDFFKQHRQKTYQNSGLRKKMNKDINKGQATGKFNPSSDNTTHKDKLRDMFHSSPVKHAQKSVKEMKAGVLQKIKSKKEHINNILSSVRHPERNAKAYNKQHQQTPER